VLIRCILENNIISIILNRFKNECKLLAYHVNKFIVSATFFEIMNFTLHTYASPSPDALNNVTDFCSEKKTAV